MYQGFKNIIGTQAALPPRLFGNIAYYLAVAAHGGNVAMNGTSLFDKRHKAAHRYEIAGASTPVSLTVPIEKPHGIRMATWADVRISGHGAWWHVHRSTLETSYGRTPFFEFYIDSLHPFLSADTPDRFRSVLELDLAADSLLRSILLLPPPPVVSAPDNAVFSAGAIVGSTSLTNARQPEDTGVAGRLAVSPDLDFTSFVTPYWQVRADSIGFLPNLSVLDLIFNLGPEAPLYLRSALARIARS